MMAAKQEKNTSQTGSNDKRSSTLGKSHGGIILPFQFIYKRKTTRLLTNVDFPDSFSLPHNEKHWNNETDTICLINVLVSN